MKFGPVPLSQAKGAILAHAEQAIGAPGETAPYLMKKGTVLDDPHLRALERAGITEITVAQLDAGDVHEDEAAKALAAALIDGTSGLRAGGDSTGRVNLRAAQAGIVALNAEAIHAVNRVDPGITVATVQPWKRLDERGLAATIKIIPYAVPALALEQACALAKGTMGLRKPVIATASLIESHVPGQKMSDKGRRAMKARMDQLDVDLSPSVIVPHDIDAIADALAKAPGELLMILTGSATSDLLDTAPQGVRAAGGQVAHYGMPVDPGNLLFIGSLGTRPVVGLPGCARSPALNGADWVLERVICGIAVGASDIAAMGVGGLLKDIPSRPLPRRAVER